MQCHYCERPAEVTVEKDGIHVGLCEEHFRDRLEELAESDMLDGLQEQLNIDRSE